MEHIACDLCSSQQHTPLFTQTDLLHKTTREFFTMVRCDSCGLVFLNPRPTPDEIGRYYPEAEYAFTNDPGAFKNQVRSALRFLAEAAYGDRHSGFSRWLSRFLLAPLLLSNTTGKIVVQNLMPSGNPFFDIDQPGTFLDIGCGAGTHAHYFGAKFALKNIKKKGFDAHGIDPSPHAREALENQGIKVQADLFSANYPDDFFDIVRLNWSLEHVHSPSRTLAECRRIMKPDGRLIIGIPNYDGITYRLYPQCVEVPVHLHYFTRATFLKYCEKTKLAVADSYQFSYVMLFLTTLSLSGQNEMADSYLRHPSRALKLQATLDLAARLGFGDDAVYLVRKVSQ